MKGVRLVAVVLGWSVYDAGAGWRAIAPDGSGVYADTYKQVVYAIYAEMGLI